jgi:hypothetical protein
MKIANKQARQLVQKEHPFEGSNLYAQFHTDKETMWYAVYSYGEHWPLFIRANGIWFENEDKHSPTTSKHRSQTHPHCPTVLLSSKWMVALAKGGYRAIARERILRGEPA